MEWKRFKGMGVVQEAQVTPVVDTAFLIRVLKQLARFTTKPEPVVQVRRAA
jgi:hypothetical protein